MRPARKKTRSKSRGIGGAAKRDDRTRTVRPEARPGITQGSEVEAVLDRLSSELARSIGHLRSEVDGPRGLARVIGADVTLCQKVLAGMKARGTASARLSQWPGAVGVRTFTQQLLSVLGHKEWAGTAALAVDSYARMIRSLATTQAKAVRVLRAAEARSQGASTDQSGLAGLQERRRDHTRTASAMLGYELDATVFISAMRPMPTSSGKIEGCSASGMLGLRTHGQRVCVAVQNSQSRQDAGTVADEVIMMPLGTPHTKGGRDGLLSEFCTQPVPLCAVEESDGKILQVVEPSTQGPAGAGVDLVLARRWANRESPCTTPNPVWSQVLSIRHPSRKLLMDVYMHRSLLGNVPPTIGAYYWHPSLPSDPRRHWQDRLPTRPVVSILDPAAPDTNSVWQRQRELSERLFELVGWSRADFVGFRCEEPFPIWGAAYHFTFDLEERTSR